MVHTFYSSKEWHELLNKKEQKMEIKVGHKYLSPDNKVVTINAIGKDNVLYSYDTFGGYEQIFNIASFIENFTRPKKKVTKWINVYHNSPKTGYDSGGVLYESEAKAKENAVESKSYQVKVEFEVDEK